MQLVWNAGLVELKATALYIILKEYKHVGDTVEPQPNDHGYNELLVIRKQSKNSLAIYTVLRIHIYNQFAYITKLCSCQMNFVITKLGCIMKLCLNQDSKLIGCTKVTCLLNRG